MSRRRWTDEQFIKAVASASNGIEAICLLGLRPLGGNYRTLYKYIKQFGLNTDHWTRRRIIPLNPRIPLAEVLVEYSTYSRWSLRKRLIEDGLLKYQCVMCGIHEWKGRKLSLHLDHINGVNTDNRLENLRFLCPNCHSLTPTYSRSSNHSLNDNFCLSCGAKISRHAIRCRSCAACACAKSKIDWPLLEELVKMVDQTSYSAVGRELGVSDNAVRKHIAKHKQR